MGIEDDTFIFDYRTLWLIVIVVILFAILMDRGYFDKQIEDYSYLCQADPIYFCNITGYPTNDYMKCYNYRQCYCYDEQCNPFCEQTRYYLQNIDGGEIYEYILINNSRVNVTDEIRNSCGWEKYEPTKSELI